MARSQPAVERQRPNSGHTISQGGFPRNIWVLGWVSLLNDSATEMSYWLLPQFLVSVLRASPMAFGFIEGAAETAASLSRLVSGFLSDRLGRRKQLVASGYTVANITKPLLALAQVRHGTVRKSSNPFRISLAYRRVCTTFCMKVEPFRQTNTELVK